MKDFEVTFYDGIQLTVESYDVLQVHDRQHVFPRFGTCRITLQALIGSLRGLSML